MEKIAYDNFFFQFLIRQEGTNEQFTFVQHKLGTYNKSAFFHIIIGLAKGTTSASRVYKDVLVVHKWLHLNEHDRLSDGQNVPPKRRNVLISNSLLFLFSHYVEAFY